MSLYRDLSKKVFVSSQDTENTAWSRLVAFSSGGINLIKAGGYYNSQFFEELLGDQIGREPMIDFSMEEHYPRVGSHRNVVKSLGIHGEHDGECFPARNIFI